MINRYDCPEISEIWSEKRKFQTYLEVELALTSALEGKKIPKGVSEAVKENSKILQLGAKWYIFSSATAPPIKYLEPIVENIKTKYDQSIVTCGVYSSEIKIACDVKDIMLRTIVPYQNAKTKTPLSAKRSKS